MANVRIYVNLMRDFNESSISKNCDTCPDYEMVVDTTFIDVSESILMVPFKKLR